MLHATRSYFTHKHTLISNSWHFYHASSSSHIMEKWAKPITFRSVIKIHNFSAASTWTICPAIVHEIPLLALIESASYDSRPYFFVHIVRSATMATSWRGRNTRNSRRILCFHTYAKIQHRAPRIFLRLHYRRTSLLGMVAVFCVRKNLDRCAVAGPETAVALTLFISFFFCFFFDFVN